MISLLYFVSDFFRARPLPSPADSIALWFAGGHYELIQSLVPEWIWEAVWRNGSPVARSDQAPAPQTTGGQWGHPEDAHGTTSVPHPAMPIAPPPDQTHQGADTSICKCSLAACQANGQDFSVKVDHSFCEALVAKGADTLPPSPAPPHDMRHHVASLPATPCANSCATTAGGTSQHAQTLCSLARHDHCGPRRRVAQS